MGVPKFYKWISERYPCLSEVVKEYQMPEFDNLYLDMNGIIHVCSHPNDDDPHFRISEEKIFADIFHYIEILFRIIKPQKVFYMAVDGVAPRAKMNQQRGRRFRSAREAIQQEKEALKKGETLPTEKRFDSNCITPGTEFMVRLQKQLKFFVEMKISTDKLWQGVRVFLSGHETPGEGEHKIMDFIRYEKSQPGYNSNTRHCLYGLDADLIILGLCSHEPNFSLLREEVRFGGKKAQKRNATPEQTTFHLLHLSLMRNYLEHEFQSLKGKLKFEFNLENIIDDWVLMGFLVGNDFIPHLPYLHIQQDALSTLYNIYMEILPDLDGYLNEAGILNLPRFEKYMKRLSELDYEKFEESYADLKWLEGKSSGKKKGTSDDNRNKFDANMFDALASMSCDMDVLNLDDQSSGEDLVDFSSFQKDNILPLSDGESLDDEEVFEMEFQVMKRDYYMNKLKLECVTPELLDELAIGYIKAIQWILHYYYNGVVSWSWYFEYHYAPFISDIKNFSNKTLEYDYSSPFLPYQQLLAVLPAFSKGLLPKAFQNLMSQPESPLIHFYPTDFKTDLNGKTQDWEAVVLVPFIDEKLMIDTMNIYEPNLTKSEVNRNIHGPCLLFNFSERSKGHVKSMLPDYFPDIAFNHSVMKEIHPEKYRLKPSEIKKGLCESIDLDVYYPGFPTLRFISYKAGLKKASVTVFHMQSRKDNMILSVDKKPDIDPAELAEELIGKSAFVSWPHIIEVKVSTVSTLNCTYKEVETESGVIKIEKQECDESDQKLIKSQIKAVNHKHMNRLGINLMPNNILIQARPMTGRKYVFNAKTGKATLEKQWSSVCHNYSYETLLKELKVHDSISTEEKTLDELFPTKSTVFILEHPHYGFEGEVLESKSNKNFKVKVRVRLPLEPYLDNIIKHKKKYSDQYLPGYVIANKLEVSSHFVSRITGSIFVVPVPKKHHVDTNFGNKINIGLNLKFNKKNEEVTGYTIKSNGIWLYSYAAMKIIEEYLDNFYEDVLGIINEKISSDVFYVDDFFPEENGLEELKKIQEFLKNLPCSNAERRACGIEVLDSGVVKAIEMACQKVKNKSSNADGYVDLLVSPKNLHQPSLKAEIMAPDDSAEYQLFDRIVCVRDGFSVPLGLRGTVIGVKKGEENEDVLCDVLFDETFDGATSYQGSSQSVYKIQKSAMINLTHSIRKNGSSPVHETNQPKNKAKSINNNRLDRPNDDKINVKGESKVKLDNPSLKSDRYERINHSPTSPFQPKTADTKHQPKAQLSKNSSKQEHFQSRNAAEFSDIWENLKSSNFSNSKVPPNTKKQKISLDCAAKSLPKVDRHSAFKAGEGSPKGYLSARNASKTKSEDDATVLNKKNEEKSANLKKLLNIPDRSDEMNSVKEAAKPLQGRSMVDLEKQNFKMKSESQMLFDVIFEKFNKEPVFKHIKHDNKVIAEVVLPDSMKFISDPCDSEIRASNVAATHALAHMAKIDSSNRKIQMRAPGHPQFNQFGHIQTMPIYHRNLPPPFVSDRNIQTYRNQMNFNGYPVYPNQRANLPVPHQGMRYYDPTHSNFHPYNLPSKVGLVGGHQGWNQSSEMNPRLNNAKKNNHPVEVIKRNQMEKQQSSTLSPSANAFVPLQVTKQQTPRKKSTNEEPENSHDAPFPVDNSPDVVKKNCDSVKEPIKKSNTPTNFNVSKNQRSRLACNFSKSS